MNLYRVYPCGTVQDTAKERVPFVGKGFERYEVIEAASESEALQKRRFMRDPNNVRNRWRRYRECMHAYGWTADTFRAFARTRSPESYGAKPGQPNERVRLFACRCKADALFCTCYGSK